MSVTLDKILCATDGSPSAQKTMVYAVEIAQRLALPLTFITITDPRDDAAPLVWDSDAIHAGNLPPDRALLEGIQVALKAGLRRVAAVRAPGDDIARAIVGYAETNSYHHIVMGSEGRTGAKRLLLGSVAADVANLAHCPVTIVR